MWGIFVYNRRVKKTLITIELFLILLIIVLFGFLLFIFTNSKIEEDPIVPVASVDTSELYCGISVTNPQIGSVVSLPLEVSGYVSGCGWEPYLNYVAIMKVYDMEKKLIGRPFLVPRNQIDASPVSTQFHIVIDDLPVAEGQFEIVFENFQNPEKIMTVPITIVANAPEDERIK